ncbi:MAG TPA: isocitrate/isopropylmalate family dehydrogenase [Planctomycetota bacterium]
MTREHRIAVLAGDGVGAEVVQQALRVLHAAADAYGFGVALSEYPHGTEHWLASGEILPDAVFDEIRGHQAVLLGAIGDPRAPVGKIERGIIGRLRWDLDLYVNLRPIKLLDARFCPLRDKQVQDVDMLFVRENTEGPYVQPAEFEAEGTPYEVASQAMRYTRRGTERIIRYAFEQALGRPRRQLTLIDKANAIRAQDLYTRVFAEIAQEFPTVETNHFYVDVAAMRMVESPESFDVAVTTNLFGDILTDLGAALQGGLGLAASANLHPGVMGLFEPVHGSFPQAAGRNVANPMAAIGAVAMMLDFLGEDAAARAVEAALATVLREHVRSLEIGVHATDELGGLVLRELAAVAAS